MIAIHHFRELIVRPALDKLQLYSIDREELLVITCAQESLGGTYLMQNDALGYPKGPALGIYQMEPVTYRDLFANYLWYNTYLWVRLMGVIGSPINYTPPPSLLYVNSHFATAVACLQYYRFKEPVPPTLQGQITYYKRYWNTAEGAACPVVSQGMCADVLKNYKKFLASG